MKIKNFSVIILTLLTTNAFGAPHVSTTYNGKLVEDGSNVYTVQFAADIYTLDFTNPGVAKIQGESEDEVTIDGRAGQLCFEPGNVDVNCGKGFHCSNEADTNKAECENRGADWDFVPRSSSVADTTCATLQEALAVESSHKGALSGDATAGNTAAWRRQVTFAFCETIPAGGSETVTTAQYGSDTSVYLEENKCHVMKPENGNIGDGNGGTCTDVLAVNANAECKFECASGYSLDRSTTCTAGKILRAGTCTLIDGDAGAGQMKPDTTDSDIGPQNNQEGDYEINDSDNLEDMNANTQYSDETLGPYNSSAPAYATAEGTLNDLPGGTTIPGGAPKCRFLPPNRIFPDALVQGQEYDSDGRSEAGKVENQGTTDNEFYADDEDVDYGTNKARVRVRFNKDALTDDAENSYNYFIIHSTDGSTESRLPDTTVTALTDDLLLTYVKIDAAGEPEANQETNDNNHFAMDHEDVTINPNDCLYDDDENTAIQTCRPTASIKFWKRYQVVIGAASKCAGPTWSNKEHVFIRATYTVDSEFELKYAPGLNLKQSGFRELEPGVWVRNRISADEPTLIMHSDYSKTMVNVAKASTTVTHASLDAFTRLELVNPHDAAHDGVAGPSADITTQEQLDNSGNNANQDGDSNVVNTGMCRDSHVHESHVSGFHDTTGDDGANSDADHDTVGCLFRARMVVQQNPESNLVDKADMNIMKSTLAGYRLDLAMSQYAQFNFAVLSNGGLAELAKLSTVPNNFAVLASDPSLADQNDPTNKAFGADVRFDICACNVKYRQVNNGVVPAYANVTGRYKQYDVVALSVPTNDTCGYNSHLHDHLKAERSDGRGLVDYTYDNNNIDGFITSGYSAANVDTVAPASLAIAAAQNGGDPQSGFTYVKQFKPVAATGGNAAIDGGIGAACTYEAFFPPGINTPFAYVRAWFKFSESTHIDQVDHDDGADATGQLDVNTNPSQWDATTGSHGNSAGDTPAAPTRRLRSLAEKTQLKAPPNVQHSVHFKFK
jgi:hypothetical protein